MALIKYFELEVVEYSKATARTSDQCQTVLLASNCSSCLLPRLMSCSSFIGANHYLVRDFVRCEKIITML